MDEDRKNKDFDDALKKRYENHTIEPEEALWEVINSRLYQKKIDNSLRRIRYLKVGIVSISIFVVTIIYLRIITSNLQHQIQTISEIEKTTDPSNKSNEKLSSLDHNIQIKKKIVDSLNNVLVSNSYETILGWNKNKSIPASLSKNTYRTIKDNCIEASSMIRINSVNKVEKIDIQKYLGKCSLTLFEPMSSFMTIKVMSDNDKLVNRQRTGFNEISQDSEKTNQDSMLLKGININLNQSSVSGLTRSDGKRFPFFIEGDISPEISYRAVTSNAQYSIPDYDKTYFNKKEKADFTFSSGVSVGFGLTQNIILKSGIYYSRYSLKFKTEAINFIKTGSNGGFVYTSSGTVNLSFSSTDSLSSESLLKSSLNFSYINVPLIAEFHFRKHYFINLGLNLNMLIGQNMNWQAEDYNGDFSDVTGDPIDGVETGSISMICGFGIDKPLTSKLSFIINPSIKINLTSLNKMAPVKSYPYSLGLNVGLRYSFN